MKIIISNTSGQPIYEQIVMQIKDLIMQGELLEEDPLPSIRNLAKELHISVITTKRAYDELEKEGFIVTVPGKGSYIATGNRELLHEKRLQIIEEKLTEAVTIAKSINLPLAQLQEILSLFYEEEA